MPIAHNRERCSPGDPGTAGERFGDAYEGSPGGAVRAARPVGITRPYRAVWAGVNRAFGGNRHSVWLVSSPVKCALAVAIAGFLAAACSGGSPTTEHGTSTVPRPISPTTIFADHPSSSVDACREGLNGVPGAKVLNATRTTVSAARRQSVADMRYPAAHAFARVAATSVAYWCWTQSTDGYYTSYVVAPHQAPLVFQRVRVGPGGTPPEPGPPSIP